MFVFSFIQSTALLYGAGTTNAVKIRAMRIIKREAIL